MSVFTKLNSVIDEKGAAYVVLIDPDRKNEDSLESYVESANISGVDALFVGGSLMMVHWMRMTHMIMMNLSVHLMMRITVMTVHLEAMIHQMMVLIMIQTVYAMMVTRMMIMMVV